MSTMSSVGKGGNEESMSQMPKQKPGKSEQVVCTPKEFLTALKAKLGFTQFTIDLAADEHNTVAQVWYDETDDSLVQDWNRGGWGFCNPPYADIEPWVAKGYIEGMKGANTAMLLPASVGSNWWKAFVHNKAYVLFTNPRLTFVGHSSPYPKDLVVLLYTSFGAKGYECWTWR